MSKKLLRTISKLMTDLMFTLLFKYWAICLHKVFISLSVIYFFLMLAAWNSKTWDFSSVQFSSVTQLSDSLWPHGLQHARPPCPSPTPGVHPNPCPLSQWCHPTISSSVVPLSSCPQSFQHQCHFKWVSSSHQVAKVLEFQLQHQSFQWTPRTDLL